ncbi:hypothetical protein [Pelosinus baikalensis]|uniref:Fibronectin type-III domain-containing protein n=1 Tax=Pelosinus baikalensis TaxID=2892015 RepID=A0ABS8HUG9_9FIRM|nr:hypothetical protein [Pelosinus baikalensis]MCC5465534.1 hypothetical protein [Pelosinus baikalensis]
MPSVIGAAAWKFVVKTVVSFAISTITNKIFGPKAKSNSPTYSFGVLQTQTNSGLVMPLIYGKVKCAGNMIWASPPGEIQHKIVSFGVGKIKGFSDVRLNDIPIGDVTLISIQNTMYPDATVKVGNVPDWKSGIYCRSSGDSFSLDCQAGITIQNIVDAINKHAEHGWTATTTLGNIGSDQIPNTKVSITNFWGVECYETPYAPHKVMLPGCSYTAYLGDGEQLIDNRVTGETQEEKAKLIGGLKYDAYLAITAKASEKLTGDFNVTATVEGRIVKVYSSPTTYTEQWTDNPAWCELDFKTSVDGCGMDMSSIDIQTYLTAAPYFDFLVNGQKRFTLNLILDEKKSRQDWLTEIFSVCRSYPTYQRGLHGILVDKPEPVSQIFIVGPDESIETWWQDNEEDVERLQIEYVDPEYEYTKVVAQADRVQLAGETSQFRNKTPLTKKISVYGINNFPQASQLAWFHLNKAQTCPEWLQYTTNKRALNRSIGDVVGIWNPITEVAEPGLTYKRYRIMQMTEPQENKITMVMQEYNPLLYTDQQGSVAPVINVTKLANPAAPPPEVEDIQLAQVYYRQNDGTIMSYITGACTFPDFGNFSEARLEYSTDIGLTWTDAGKTNSDGTFIIDNVKTGINYLVRIKVVNRMGIVSNGVVSEPIYITGKDAPPSNVPSLTTTIDSTDSTKINLTWPAVTDIDLRGYRLMEGETILTFTPILDTRYTYIAKSSRQYVFSVVAADNSGNPSEIPAVKLIDITVEPSQVAGFSAVLQDTDRSRLNLSWKGNSEQDISYYEIRVGDDWEHSTLIATQLKANTYTHVLTAEGSQNFMIKAINIAGFASQQFASQRLQITLRPDTVTNLQAVQEPRDRSMVKVTWTASPGKDIAGYELRYGNDWASGTLISTVKESTYWWYIPASGTYNIMVQARTVAGYVSNIANETIAAMIEAYDVTGFGAIQLITDRTKIRLSWDQPLSLDVAYFEIRKGTTWDTGIVVGQRVTGTYYDVIVTEEISQTFWIKSVTVAGKYSQNPAKVEGIFNMNPDPVTNILLAQDVNDRSVLNISFTGISESDLVAYEIRVGYAWDTAVKIGETKELRWTYKPPSTGDVKVIIKSENSAGYYSDEASENIYVMLEPATVTGLQVLQNGEYNELFWDKHPDPDVVAYEIREGASFELGALVASGVTLNSYAVKVDVERNYRYHIKAINRANKYSINAVTQSVFVENLPPKNVILTYDDITLQTGTMDNVEFGQSLINWSNIGGIFSDYPTTKFSDIGGQNVLKLLKSGGVYPSSGTYICQTIDVGQIITANISMRFISSVILRGTGSAVLQIRTSRDGMTWTAWQDFRPAQYTFRYLDRMIILGTTDPTKTPEVNQITTSIDVDDVEAVGSVLIPVGGATISYGKNFYTVPIVTPMALGDNKFPQVLTKTDTEFTVKIVNRAGTDVGGQLDWRAKGY